MTRSAAAAVALVLAGPLLAGAGKPQPPDAGEPTAVVEKTLVDGQPPLTDVMLAKLYEFYEWVYETQLTRDQQKRLEAYLVDAWKGKKEREISDALDTLRNHDDVARMTEDERNMLRSQVQPQMLKELARDKSPMAKWALGVVESARKPLIAGKPPLTRQATDAYSELFSFVVSQASSGAAFEPDLAFRDQFAKEMMAAWKKASPAEKEALAKVPDQWAAVRTTWPTASEADKAKLKKQWSEDVAGFKPKGPVGKADGGSAAAPADSAKWAQGLLGAPHPVNLALLTHVAETGWRYTLTHW